MNRITMLAQATSVVFLLAVVTALAYRRGGRRQLWVVSGVSLAALEVFLVWLWVSSPSEGPLWLTTISVIPPLLFVSFSVELLARKGSRLAVQILVGTATGLVGYIATAFVAYALLVTLF